MMMWMRLGAEYLTSVTLPGTFYYYLRLLILLYARFSSQKNNIKCRCCKAFCFLSQFYEQSLVPVLPKRGADLVSNLGTLTNSTRRKRNKEAKRSKRRGEKHLEIPPLRLPADSATANKAGSRQTWQAPLIIHRTNTSSRLAWVKCKSISLSIASATIRKIRKGLSDCATCRVQ